MTDLTDVNIKELLEKSDAELRAELEALLPKPAYPEHLLGVWATHPERGEVLCVDDKPDGAGDVKVYWRDERSIVGAYEEYVPVSSLTFSHQVTKPEDVPVGEAWLVNVTDGKDSGERVVALKCDVNEWHTGMGLVNDTHWWLNDKVTLVEPLVPATPAPEPEHVETEEEYNALPHGSIVVGPGMLPWIKMEGGWTRPNTTAYWSNRELARGLARGLAVERHEVLRKGWGNE